MAEACHVEIHDDNSLYDFIDLITRSHYEFDVQSLQYVNLDTILPELNLPSSLPVLDNSFVDKELSIPWTGGTKYCCVNKVYSYMFDVFKEEPEALACSCEDIDPPSSVEDSASSSGEARPRSVSGSFLQPRYRYYVERFNSQPLLSPAAGRSRFSSCSDTTNNSCLSDTSDVDSDYISSDNLSDIFVTENCDNLNFKIELLNNSRGSPPSCRALPDSAESSPTHHQPDHGEPRQFGPIGEETPAVPGGGCAATDPCSAAESGRDAASEQFRMPHLYSTLVGTSSLLSNECLPEVSVKQEAEAFAGIKVSCNNVCREYDELAREGKSKFKTKKNSSSGEFIGRITINVTKFTKNSIRTRVDIVRKRYGANRRSGEKKKSVGGRKIEKYRGSEERDSCSGASKSSVGKTKQSKRNIAKKKKPSGVTTNYSRKSCKYEYRGKAQPVGYDEDGSCVSVKEEKQVDVKTEELGGDCENVESGRSPKKKRPEKSSVSNGIGEKAKIGTDCQQSTKLENENNTPVRTDKPRPESERKRIDSGQDKQKVRKDENLAQEKAKHKQRNDKCESKSVHNASKGKCESSGDKRKDRSRHGSDKSQTEKHRGSNRDKSDSHEKSSSCFRNNNHVTVSKTSTTKSEPSEKDNQIKQVSSNNKTDLVSTSHHSSKKLVTKSKTDDKHSVNQKNKKLNSETYSKPHSSVHKLEILPNNNMKEIDKHKNNLDNVKHHKRKSMQDTKSSTHKSSSIISSKDYLSPNVSNKVQSKQLDATKNVKDSSRNKNSHSNELNKVTSAVSSNKTKVENEQKIENGLSNSCTKPIVLSTKHTNHSKEHNVKNVSHKLEDNSKENFNSKNGVLKASPDTCKISSSDPKENNDKTKVKTNESVNKSEQLKEECKKIVEKYLKKKKENLTNESSEKLVIPCEPTVKEDNVIPNNTIEKEITIVKEKETNKKKVMNLDEYKKRKGQYLPKKTIIIEDENALNKSKTSAPKLNGQVICENNKSTLITSRVIDATVDKRNDKYEIQRYGERKDSSLETVENQNKITIVNNVVIEKSPIKENSINSDITTNSAIVKLEVDELTSNSRNSNKIEGVELTKDLKETSENKTNMDRKIILENLKTKVAIKIEKGEPRVEHESKLIPTDEIDKLIFRHDHKDNEKALNESIEQNIPNSIKHLGLTVKSEKLVVTQNNAPLETIIVNHPNVAKSEKERSQQYLVNNETKFAVPHDGTEHTKSACVSSNENQISHVESEKDNDNLSKTEHTHSIEAQEKPNVSTENDVESINKELITVPKTIQEKSIIFEKDLGKISSKNDSPQKLKAPNVEKSSDDTEEGEIIEKPSETRATSDHITEQVDISDHQNKEKQEHETVNSAHNLSNNKDNVRIHSKEKEILDAGRVNTTCAAYGRDQKEEHSKTHQRRVPKASSRSSRERQRKRKSRSTSSSSSSSSSGSSRSSCSSSSSDSSSSSHSSSSSSSSYSSSSTKPTQKRPKHRPTSSLSKASHKSMSTNFRPRSRNYEMPRVKFERSYDQPKRSHKRPKNYDPKGFHEKEVRDQTKRPCLISSAGSKLGRPEGMEPLKIELHYGKNDKMPPKRCINLARPQKVTNEVQCHQKSNADGSNHKSLARDEMDSQESDLNKSHISISDTSLDSGNTTKPPIDVDLQGGPCETNEREENLASSTHSEMDKTRYSPRNGMDAHQKSTRHLTNSKTPTKDTNASPDASLLKSVKRSRSLSSPRTQNNSISPSENLAETRNSRRSKTKASRVRNLNTSPRAQFMSTMSFRENCFEMKRSPSCMPDQREFHHESYHSKSPGKHLQQHERNIAQLRNGRANPRNSNPSENHFPLHSDFIRNKSDAFVLRRASPTHARSYDNTLRRSRSKSPGHKKYTPLKSNATRVKPSYRHASSNSPSPERASPRRNPISADRTSGFPSALSRRNRSYRKRERSSSLEARSGSSTEREFTERSSGSSDSEASSSKGGRTKKPRKRSLSNSSSQRSSPESDAASAEWKRGMREYRTMFVGNILPSTSVQELRVRFQRFGTVTDVHVVRKFFEHYAYVTFKRADPIRNAIERGNDPYFVDNNYALPVVGPYYLLDYATPDYDQQDVVRRVGYQVKYADSFESTLASTMELLSRRKKQKVQEGGD